MVLKDSAAWPSGQLAITQEINSFMSELKLDETCKPPWTFDWNSRSPNPWIAETLDARNKTLKYSSNSLGHLEHIWTDLNKDSIDSQLPKHRLNGSKQQPRVLQTAGPVPLAKLLRSWHTLVFRSWQSEYTRSIPIVNQYSWIQKYIEIYRHSPGGAFEELSSCGWHACHFFGKGSVKGCEPCPLLEGLKILSQRP